MTAKSSPPTRETDELPSYDESLWPIFVARMPPLRMSSAAFAAHLDRLSGLHDRGVPFCILLDMGRHPSLPAVQRKLIAARIKHDASRRPHSLRGCALVVHSAFERGVVTAINWVAEPPAPFKCFPSATEALVWLRHLLAKNG